MSIRKILLSLLGEKRYLSAVAGFFPYIYRAGLLGRNYQDIYFLKQIIAEGSWCVDIGAHLGYYTLELSRLAGDSGRVLAIEPMGRFNRTLQQLLKRRRIRNVSLYQVALGGTEDWVEMGIPRIGREKKFAYARVMESNAWLEFEETEKVKNEYGDHLFLGLPRLDFIKCDVEGLEVQVFMSMMGTLGAHRPMLLCELADKAERIRLYELISPLGYHAYTLEKGYLLRMDPRSDHKAVSHNHYFIPPAHEQRLGRLIRDSSISQQ
ncbi:MAG: FkbM family methyltransferase [Bacteroidota bacterium]|nr:FkbM family methyltransferase [Bacteroidota bacterium]MDP4216594.1 FkbM family methyltransferase [Bacteroidota bacterium]MDP4245862.1 FkbM family methyltransferase [Bacteroidota bacterium]MDP4255767.1 FkbM family methyltransferase [Bacteroidota bacterium]MDP4256612.1 FkbM family methyltransferase [Bacteroidota bacterium]